MTVSACPWSAVACYRLGLAKLASPVSVMDPPLGVWPFRGRGSKLPRYKAQASLRTRAPESASGQRGESPLQANALRPVTECNCVAAMRGGEQQEVNDPVRRITNSIRPVCIGEPASERRSRDPQNGRPVELRGSVQKRRRGHAGWLETEWIRKATCVNQGDLLATRDGVHARKSRRAGRAGVRAPIVARKLRNGSGAKGAQEGG